MANPNSSTKSKSGITSDIFRIVIYLALLVGGFYALSAYWTLVAFSHWGDAEQASLSSDLIGGGVVASIAPLIIYFISKFKWWWLAISLILLITVPVLAAYRFNIDLMSGYPNDSTVSSPQQRIEF